MKGVITLDPTDPTDVAALAQALRLGLHDPSLRLWDGVEKGSLAVLVLEHLVRRRTP